MNDKKELEIQKYALSVVGEATSKEALKKIIRKEVQKVIKDRMRYYIDQILPDDEEIAKIVYEAVKNFKP